MLIAQGAVAVTDDYMDARGEAETLPVVSISQHTTKNGIRAY